MEKLRISRQAHDALKSRLTERVQGFMQARNDHAHTVGIPAPLEDPIVMRIAELGGLANVEIETFEDETPRGGTAPHLVSPATFRSSFSFAERCAIELAAQARIAKGDASMRVLWDDLNTLSTVDLNNDDTVRFFELLEADRVLTAKRKNQLRKKDFDSGPVAAGATV